MVLVEDILFKILQWHVEHGDEYDVAIMSEWAKIDTAKRKTRIQ